jgi:hypothetical protein
MNRPPRPFGDTPKIRWQQAIYDAMGELEPRIGPGVYLQDTVRATLRRLMRGKNNFGRDDEEEDTDPAFFRFGFATNRWGPYPLGTSVVATSVTYPDYRFAPEIQRYFTYNGSPVQYPGELTPPGVLLPGTFRFTSPFRKRRCRIVGITTGAEWENPVPEILSPGQSVDFNAPAYAGVVNILWAARKI